MPFWNWHTWHMGCAVLFRVKAVTSGQLALKFIRIWSKLDEELSSHSSSLCLLLLSTLPCCWGFFLSLSPSPSFYLAVACSDNFHCGTSKVLTIRLHITQPSGCPSALCMWRRHIWDSTAGGMRPVRWWAYPEHVRLWSPILSASLWNLWHNVQKMEMSCHLYS